MNMNNLKYYFDRVERLFAEEQFMGTPSELYAPIDYTLRLGGKRIRPTLLLAANALFGGKEDEALGAALGIETFHNFTLLHDDLMDRSPLRRGQPTVYIKWDENTAVLSGDTMYALSWRYMLRTPGEGLLRLERPKAGFTPPAAGAALTVYVRREDMMLLTGAPEL